MTADGPGPPGWSTPRDDRRAGLIAFDRDHLWHPYSALPPAVPSLLVESTSGTRLTVATASGRRELVDAMSSWWSTIHGYGHPRLVAAAQRQVEQMSHVMFGGLTHEPAVRLAEHLCRVAPPRLDRVFFCDSGSVAVEVALKMAIQYWSAQGNGRKNRILTWRSGYHGDTLFGMSVCDPDLGMHALWSDIVPRQVFAPEPPSGFDAPIDETFVEGLASAVRNHADELAAIIVEPVVQGAGGMRFHNPSYVRRLRQLADDHDVLLVLDEIATGFGRTGTYFACDQAGVAPDIMCVGKALTGGMMSLAATLCTDSVAQGVSGGGAGLLAHGPTFMANPLACAVAAASLELLDDYNWEDSVARIASLLTAGLSHLADRRNVVDVRVLGAIGVVELGEPVDLPKATAAAIAHGVWLRPFRNLVYTMPPYVATDDEVRSICTAVEAVVDQMGA